VLADPGRQSGSEALALMTDIGGAEALHVEVLLDGHRRQGR
jgi:hypothetical protein